MQLKAPPNKGIEAPQVFDIQCVTKEQLAKQLGDISVSFINKLMREEGLPHFKLGRAVRFHVGEVAEWLQNKRRP